MVSSSANDSSGLVLPEYYEPGTHEVIVGRGKKVNSHPANLRFKRLIA
mgnify:CR=1 FL=1